MADDTRLDPRQEEIKESKRDLSLNNTHYLYVPESGYNPSNKKHYTPGTYADSPNFHKSWVLVDPAADPELRKYSNGSKMYKYVGDDWDRDVKYFDESQRNFQVNTSKEGKNLKKEIDKAQKTNTKKQKDYEKAVKDAKTELDNQKKSLDEQFKKGNLSEVKYKEELKKVEANYNKKMNDAKVKSIPVELPNSDLNIPVYTTQEVPSAMKDVKTVYENKQKDINVKVKNDGEIETKDTTLQTDPANKEKVIKEKTEEVNKVIKEAPAEKAEAAEEIISELSNDDFNTKGNNKGDNFNALIDRLADQGKKLNPYYNETLPGTIFGAYKRGKLGRIDLTDEERSEVIKASRFTEEEKNNLISKERQKLLNAGKTEEEVEAYLNSDEFKNKLNNLEAKQVKKALREKQREISKPARDLRAYFIMDYISKALNNVGSDIAAVGGKNIARNDSQPLFEKYINDPLAKGGAERLNTALGKGLENQANASSDYSSNETAEIRGDTNLKEQKALALFTQEQQKELQSYINNLDKEKQKDLARFMQELQKELKKWEATDIPAAELEGMYNRALSSLGMDKNAFKNVRDIIYAQSQDSKITHRDVKDTVFKSIDSVSNLIGSIGEVIPF